MSDFLYFCSNCDSLVVYPYLDADIFCDKCGERMDSLHISEDEWNAFSDKEKYDLFERYRNPTPHTQRRQSSMRMNNFSSNQRNTHEKSTASLSQKGKGKKDYNGQNSSMSIAALILSFFGCFGIIGIILGIIDLQQKDGRKKALSIAAIAVGATMILLSVAAAGASSDILDKSETAEETEETTKEMTEDENAEKKIQNSHESSGIEQDLMIGGENKGDRETIELIAGELGEYGQELVLNEGTEFEDKPIGYFVPTGKYEVTNIGERMTQVNIYKNEKNKTEEGWEEWTDPHVELLDVGDTKEMTIEDGYFFNIDEPSHILVKMIDNPLSVKEGEKTNDEKKVLRDTFNASLGDNNPLWHENVNRDKTGKWRELVIYSSKPVDKDIAVEYAKAYIEDDDEIHWITNLYLRTVSRLIKMENIVGVTTFEYRDGEENDANELGGGTVLDSFTVDLNTGEVLSTDN